MKLLTVAMTMLTSSLSFAQVPVVLLDFERGVQVRQGSFGLPRPAQVTLSRRDPFKGKGSLWVTYTFERIEGLQYLELIRPFTFSAPIRRLSLAVRGDGSGQTFRARFVDRTGEWHQFDLGPVSFTGWRVLAADLDGPRGYWDGDKNGILDYPVTFYSIVLDSTVRPGKGTVGLDDLVIEAEGRAEDFVNVDFEPRKPLGYFFGKDQRPSGVVHITTGTRAAALVSLTVRLLNYKREPIADVFKGDLKVSYASPWSRSLSLPLTRFGAWILEAEINAVKRQFSVAWLAHRAPIWNESPFGVVTHFAQFKHQLPITCELVRNMGAGWIRDELYWSEVEKEKGIFTFPDYYDRYVTEAHRLGLHPMIILNYANRHYDDGHAPGTDDGRAAFARYVREVVGRYAKVCTAWEVWNEPNIGFWQPKPNPQDYARLLEIAYHTIKEADPQATVVAMCTAGTDLGFIESVLKSLTRRSFDVVSVHPYRYPQPPEASGFLNELKNLRDLIVRTAGEPVRVWLTEFGYPTHRGPGGVSEDRSAVLLTRTCLLALTLPFVERLFIYDFQDDGDNPEYNEHNFGMIRLDGTPKVAYCAHNTMAQMLFQKKFRKWWLSGHKGLYACEFSGSEGSVLAMWAADGNGRIRVGWIGGNPTLTDLMGNDRRVGGDRSFRDLEVTEEPVFFWGYRALTLVRALD